MKKISELNSFEDFLEDENLLDEVDCVAVKRVLAYQLREEMKAKKITKTKMAELMKTSRSVIDRLLSPTNTSLTLQTLQNATSVLGKKLSIEIR